MNTLFIVLSVVITGLAQICFKLGMRGFDFQKFSFEVIGNILSNPYVLMGSALYIVSMFLWLYVLSKVDLSYAYPFVGVSFVMIVIFGFYSGEAINLFKILGVICIVGGIVFISRS